MISRFSFSVRRVRDFLATNGHVITVRGYNYKSQTAVVPQLDGIHVTRRCIGTVTCQEDLNVVLPISGFKSTKEWWKQIKMFCKGTMYVYLVEIDEAYLNRMKKDAERMQKNHQNYQEEFQNNHPLDPLPDLEVELQTAREMVHDEVVAKETTRKMQRDQKRRASKRRRLHESNQPRGVPDVDMQAHNAAVEAWIDDLVYDIKNETDLGVSLNLLDSLEIVRMEA